MVVRTFEDELLRGLLRVPLLALGLFVLEIEPSALAITSSMIYVDAQISVTSCNNYNPTTRTCGSGSSMAYKSLNAAASAASSGTTVLIRQATYNEQLAPQRSGLAGNFIMFQSYPAEAVFITGAPAINLSGRSFIVVDGVHVENTTWLEAVNASNNIVRNCVFKKTPATGTTGNIRFIQSAYNLILNNDIEDGQDNVLLIDSNYNLVEGNTIKEARHSIFGIRCGDYNIIRGNFFSNTQQKIGEVYDCGTDTSAVPHSFNSTRHNLIENNIFAGTVTYYSTSGGNGIQYAGQEGIIRRNVFYDCNVGLGMQVYGDEALYNLTNRVYNNVFFRNVGPGISVRAENTNDVFKNNILLGNQGCLPACTNLSPGQVVYRGSLGQTTLWERNDILYQNPGQLVIEVEFGSGKSITQMSNAFPGVLVGTLELDPFFVNASAHDFHLQTGSPMVDAGAYLTRTTAAGNGTNIVVLDARYFQDGFGIPGQMGDTIQLEGQTKRAGILKVNYTNNTLTLDQPLVWTAGQGVALQYSGNGPDLGAKELSTTPPPLRVTRQMGTVVAAWPLFDEGYHLEASSSLAPANWQTAGGAVLRGDEWAVTNALSSSNAFFRLAK
jgi:Right handed beta helix region